MKNGRFDCGREENFSLMSERSFRQPPVAVLVSRPRLKAVKSWIFLRSAAGFTSLRFPVLGIKVPGGMVLSLSSPKDLASALPLERTRSCHATASVGIAVRSVLIMALEFSPPVHQASAPLEALTRVGLM